MARLYADDILQQYGGYVRCFDLQGREIEGVVWVDPEEHTFATITEDEDAAAAAVDRGAQPEAVRYGTLRLERKA